MKHLLNEPWAIAHTHQSLVLDLMKASQNTARLDAPDAPSVDKREGIGVLSIHGPLFNRGDLMSEWLGIPIITYQRIARRVTAMAADPTVKEIVLDFDSPGGVALNTDEAAAAIKAAAQVKPVTAVVNGYAASAAYWLASQATRIVVTPLSSVGSIGVISIHADYSQFYSDAGIDVQVYRTGSMKALGQSFDTQDQVAAAFAQEQSEILRIFAQAVADGRGFTVEEVLARFALDSGLDGALAGNTVLGARAVQLGLADEVATLESTLSSIISRSMGGRRARMDKEQETITLDAAKQQATAAVEARQAAIQEALGVDNLNTDTLTGLKALAADGRQYRADLLDRLHAATVRVEGNNETGVAAADRAKRVFANADVRDILAEVTRLEAKDVVPEGRQSAAVEVEETPATVVDYSGL